ncbi:AEC family transporter [Comamonas faecalis]|uniref:AEC family transporter n=1 Tax=Comamonas faecalis TaxID=1387849 RepID=A0ABP7RIZ2_9BURK
MNYAELLFPDFSLILAGYLVCRLTALNRSVWQPVEALVYYLLFPVLLFHSIVKTPIEVGEMSRLMAAGLAMTAGGIALSQLLARLPGLRQRIAPREHAGAAQVAFRFNTFVALALADRLAGAAGLQLVAVLVGVCVPLVNLAAVWPMAHHGNQRVLRELARNPLVIATVSGLACNLAGLQLPGWATPPLQRIGASAIALGLMAAGAGLQWGHLQHNRTLSAVVLTIRHLLLPLWAWALVRLMGLDATQSAVLMAFSALPTASSCYVLAVRMGYNGPYVAGLITLSTLLALASLPLALGVLR